MPVYELDPQKDARWMDLLERHPKASAFHTQSWLEALRRTYGYQAVALTTTPPGQPLRNGLVLCRVDSWLTGHRMVSLPFADHCEPLVSNPEEGVELLSWLQAKRASGGLKYVELRPLTALSDEVTSRTAFGKSANFCFHKLDLRPSLDSLLRSFHKTSCTQMLQRASREGLILEEGRSESLLNEFYALFLLTRRRHQLPPQPLSWFRNLIDCFGEKLVIRLARKDQKTIAGLLSICYKKSVIYKYGCSDAERHKLGGVPFVLWHAIRESKEQGAEEFDLGRSDLDNPGLMTFKDRWAGTRSELMYYRSPSRPSREEAPARGRAFVGKILSSLPDVCLTAAGRLLYKHVG
jgi:hypothetical protein